MKLLILNLFFILFFYRNLISQICLTDSSFVNYKLISEDNREISYRSDLLKINVVFHIVLPEDIQPPEDFQVSQQVEALNRDFRKKNIEWKSLSPELSILASDTGIEFCLASADPLGRPTSGITRTVTNVRNLGLDREKVSSTSAGGKSPWPTNRYMNVWVTELPLQVLGYASSPLESGELTDGVVINYQNFGMAYARPSFRMGRTLVHEIGHYLGLLHTWGLIIDNCDEDDGIADTPPQLAPHVGCPPRENQGCQPGQIYGNYMDYTPDCCMGMFTEGQARIMRSVLKTHRKGVLVNKDEYSCNDEENLNFVIFPNPSNSICTIIWHQDFESKALNVYLPSGQLVRQFDVTGRSQFELCLDNFPKGILILQLVSSAKKVLSNRLLHY